MNWFGFDARSLAGALVGALLFGWGLSRGLDLPWVVGLAVGGGAMALARDRNTMRGGPFAVLAVWTGALTQALVGPFAEAGLWHLSSTLDAKRVGYYVTSALLAAALGARSIRRGAARRVAGT